VLSRDVQVIVDGLAERLHRSVVIGDRDLHVLYSSRHFHDEDPVRIEAILNREANSRAIEHVVSQGVGSWTKPGVIPPNPELGMEARVCLPMRWSSELLGFMMVIDANGSVTARDMAALSEAAGQLVPHLAAVLLVAGHPLDEVVREVISPIPAVRSASLAGMASGLVADFPTATAICLQAVERGVDGAAAIASVALRSSLTLPTPPGVIRQAGTVDGCTAMLLLGSRGPLPRRTTQRHAQGIVARVRERASDTVHVVVGLGPCVEGLERAHESAEAAGRACRAAALGLLDPIAYWDELGAYGPLLRIPANQLNLSILPDQMTRLLDIDRERQLATTLRAYLDAGCSAQGASEALVIHRTTLYYRLRRIEELTGLDLSDGSTLLALYSGLLLLDIIDRSSPEA